MEDEETELGEGGTQIDTFLEFKKRLDAAEIKYEITEIEDLGGFIEFELPAGRDKRSRVFLDDEGDRIKSLLSYPFEKYVFLGDYEAVALYEAGIIEATFISASARRLPTKFLIHALSRAYSSKWTAEDDEKTEDDKKSSAEFLLQTEKGIAGGNIKLSISNRPFPLLNGPLSIKIENLSISEHDVALDILERVSGALFFQIDMLTNIPCGLNRTRSDFRRPIRKSVQSNIVGFNFPEYQYNKAPLSLYFYAKGATQMPLLQFFAFYQAIEFYFPVYSQREAARRVLRVLKDPTFNKSQDTDIIRLIDAVGSGSKGGFGDERSQLKATLKECVDEKQLRDFIENNVRLKDFYSSKEKKISSCVLPVKNPTTDLRSKVGDRIYDIRCKIVHTKSGENTEEAKLLLPFSKEAEMLYYDIELLEFVARQGIIESSKPMTI